MRGHIRKKTWTTKAGEERYCYEVIVYTGQRTATGRPKLASFAAKTEKEAERILRERLAQADAGGIVAPSRITLKALLEEHYLPHAKQTLRPTTYASYEIVTRKHVLPALGHLRVEKITPATLNRFYRELADAGASPRLVRYCHAILHRAFKLAVKWRLATYNPAANADPPAVPRKEMQTLDADGIRRLLDAAQGDRLYPLWLLAVATGMRRGELCGLKWEDVDFEGGAVIVRRNLVMVNGRPAVQEPKTARSRRRVKLPASCLEALKAWRHEQKKERLAHGPGYEDSGYVFTQGDGKPLRPDLLTKRHFPRLLAKAGLPEALRLHDLRHSHATALLQAGTPAKVISERLGHFSTAFTMDTYAHVAPSLEQEAADRFDAIVFGDGQKKEKRQG